MSPDAGCLARSLLARRGSVFDSFPSPRRFWPWSRARRAQPSPTGCQERGGVASPSLAIETGATCGHSERAREPLFSPPPTPCFAARGWPLETPCFNIHAINTAAGEGAGLEAAGGLRDTHLPTHGAGQPQSRSRRLELTPLVASRHFLAPTALQLRSGGETTGKYCLALGKRFVVEEKGNPHLPPTSPVLGTCFPRAH